MHADRPALGDLAGRVGVLAHPSAGRGRVGRHLAEVLAALGPADPLVLSAATATDVLAAAHDAVRSDVAGLVAVGGDGTAHLAIQAVAGTGVPLGLVPLGTGNDLADAVGVPSAPAEAARAIVADLAEARTTPIDAVRVTGAKSGGEAHWYAAILSVGFDSAVNARANRMRWPRGPRRYDLAILAELARLRTYSLSLRLDGTPVETPALLAAFGNTRSYGGGMRMCPDADPTDGLLDVTVVSPVSRLELIRVKPRLYDGSHVTHPSARTYRAATIEVDAPGAAVFADGEPFLTLPLTLTVVPRALRLLGARLPG
ncbi:diacylglycerol/lipid kinase family protein [Cryptosporangium phraense]|uniref:Sphingosine kinase n=1 Tax=Cryptosporangium phraense TaxID=2593070 RepID=A0A545AZJ5_9ACTN|nr:diacylglycerol kinase family protein [Cryptosporangium phraense]TQS46737.1 sphingosine kinase [Cryptosporangium phraense]